jgi:phosphohistidine phosphatase
MVVGHNPGLTEVANSLLDESISNISTTGVVGAQLNINSWKDTRWGCGEMIFFDFPKKK